MRMPTARCSSGTTASFGCSPRAERYELARTAHRCFVSTAARSARHNREGLSVSVDFLCAAGTAPAGALRVLIGLADCCIGAFEDGPAGCTCWEPVFAVEQSEPATSMPVLTRSTMCDDCAYKPGSPERSGDDRYQCATEDGSPPSVPAGAVFFCHQGMRKPIEWRHTKLGITVTADSDAYDPPIIGRRVEGFRPVLVPYKADGTPGERCAGWAAHSRELGERLTDLAKEI